MRNQVIVVLKSTRYQETGNIDFGSRIKVRSGVSEKATFLIRDAKMPEEREDLLGFTRLQHRRNLDVIEVSGVVANDLIEQQIDLFACQSALDDLSCVGRDHYGLSVGLMLSQGFDRIYRVPTNGRLVINDGQIVHEHQRIVFSLQDVSQRIIGEHFVSVISDIAFATMLDHQVIDDFSGIDQDTIAIERHQFPVFAHPKSRIRVFGGVHA